MRDAYSGVPFATQLQLRREILDGARVGPPRQLLAGPQLDTMDPAMAQRQVDSLKAAGADMLKVYPFTPELAAAAHRAGIPFGGHVHPFVTEGLFADSNRPGHTTTEASDSGARILDHLIGVAGLTVCYRGVTRDSIAPCKEQAALLRRNGTWLVPTLQQGGVRSREAYARFLKAGRAYWTGQTVNPYAAPRLRDTTRDTAAASSPEASGADNLADSLGILYVAQQSGVPILIGTDTGEGSLPGAPAGFSLHLELEVSVLEGMTPLSALQAATLNPAKMLQGTDSLGTVAQGKLADLVLLDANPLDDITNTRTIRAVVANGRHFDRAALDQILAEVQVKAKAAYPDIFRSQGLLP